METRTTTLESRTTTLEWCTLVSEGIAVRDDEDAPLIELRFFNKGQRLPMDAKERIGRAMYAAFVDEYDRAFGDGSAAPPRLPIINLTVGFAGPVSTFRMMVSGHVYDVAALPDWNAHSMVSRVLNSCDLLWPRWELRDDSGCMIATDTAGTNVTVSQMVTRAPLYLNQPAGVGG